MLVFKQVLSIITDNTSNNITFLKAIETIFSVKNLEFNIENQYVRCLTYIINLVVQQVLQLLNIEVDSKLNNEIEINNNI